jgi:putative ABC transport system ATP-binding protein
LSFIVEVEGVTKRYVQGTVEVMALRGLTFQMQPGEFTAIVGPSGSGKSTALNLIGALDRPTAGTIRVDGRDLSELSARELSHLRRDRIGFVFQAYNLMPVLTAYENAEIVLALQRVDPGERRDRVMKLLKDVGLDGLEHRRPNELSGGQQQRVAIARAIASNPAIILADEPTANVDSETADSLLALMEELNERLAATFLFSTHDARVMDRARRIIHIVDGRVEGDEVKAT